MMRIWWQRLGRVLLVGLVGLTACQSAGAASSNRLPVVATFSVLGDWVRQVGGDRVEVRVLVPVASDAHTFAPTVADAASLASAAVIFANGLGFEPWLEDLYRSSASQATQVVVTDGLAVLQTAGVPDPHVWHDVVRVKAIIGVIRDALSAADPAGAATYQANADAYLAQLTELDQWILQQVATLPAAARVLVTTHDTFAYFADRYGFQVLGTILPTSTEGAAPSAQMLAALAEAVRASGVKAVFAENVSANTLLNQVAAEAGVTVVASLYTDALGVPGTEGDTYLKLMRFNVTTLVKALTGAP